jgi:hypothetical protein
MAHFAQLDDDNKVLQVIRISNTNAPDPAPYKSEAKGQKFIASLGLEGLWLQTSYNGAFRGRYAGIGFFYYEDLDVFAPPKPFPSWVLNSDYCWDAPVPKPDNEDYFYEWDENTLSWVGYLKPVAPSVEVLGDE